MAKYYGKFIIIIFIAFFSSNLALDEDNAEEFIKQSSSEIYEILNNVASLAFHFDSLAEAVSVISDDHSIKNVESDEADLDEILSTMTEEELLHALSKNISEFSKEASKFNYQNFKNEDLKRGLQNIHFYSYQISEDETESDDTDFVEKLNSIAFTENICSYKDKSKCDLNYANDIRRIMHDSDDPEELKYYWESWRQINKKISKENIGKLAAWFRKNSNQHKVNPSILWYGELMDENFANDMEKVITEIQPIYQNFHAFIRSVLSKKYGEDVVPPNGLISDHLMEKAIAEIWKYDGMYSNLLSQDDTTDMGRVLRDNKISARSMLNIADDFFTSLGLSNLPGEFWTDHLEEINDDEQDENECSTVILDITPTVYMKYCPEVDMQKFLQMHAWMARLHYANEKKDLLFPFFKSYMLEYPVGEAAILSALSVKHMSNLNLLKNTTYSNKNQIMNRLIRMGVHTIMQIPQYFIQSKIINDLISEKVELDQLNQYYWDLMKKYAGVSPPSSRESDDMDFSFDFYDDIEYNGRSQKLFSEVLGYQIYEALCIKSGQYEIESDSRELQNCDFYGNIAAGKLLKNMMQLGSKKSWRQVLSVLTGNEDGISGRAINAYFAPANKWLKEYNLNNNVIPGW